MVPERWRGSYSTPDLEELYKQQCQRIYRDDNSSPVHWCACIALSYARFLYKFRINSFRHPLWTFLFKRKIILVLRRFELVLTRVHPRQLVLTYVHARHYTTALFAFGYQFLNWRHIDMRFVNLYLLSCSIVGKRVVDSADHRSNHNEVNLNIIYAIRKNSTFVAGSLTQDWVRTSTRQARNGRPRINPSFIPKFCFNNTMHGVIAMGVSNS